MLSYYFKIATRSLRKQKMYTAIKVGGFAIGVAACTLIALFIHHELNYDNFYRNGQHLYRVVRIYRDGALEGRGVDCPAPFAPAMKDLMPEIETIARLNPNTLFTGGGNSFRRSNEVENHYEEGFAFADPEMLDLLEVSMVYGDRKSALAQPNSIVISKKISDMYFPGENPVGKTLIFNDDTQNPKQIGGVMQDFPDNTHLNFDFLITKKGLDFWPGEQTDWGASNYHTYLSLRAGTNVKAFEGKMLDAFFDNFYKDYLKNEGMDEAAISKIRGSTSLELQPISQIHLHSAEIKDTFSHGDQRMIWLFGTIAICIFLLACINFINLSTARSMERAKEVGVRKAVGSQRIQLVSQFLAESVILSLGAFVLGLLLANICLPFFNEMADKSLAMPWTAWWFLPLLAVAAIVVGLMAGLYPALYMCAFQPIRVLKGNLSRSKKNTSLRSTLVVFQFATSAALVIGAIVVLRQMNFISNTRLGYDKEQVLLLQGTQALGDKIPALQQELRQVSGVKSVSSSDYLPIVGGGSKRNTNTFHDVEKGDNSNEIELQIWTVDHHYISTLGMKIVEGRDFAKDMAGDSQAIIINQTMAKALNSDNPIGKRLSNNSQTFTVIGVVEDFHFESMKENIGNLCLHLGSSPGITAVKINAAEMPKTIEAVTKVWKKMSPSQAIRYTFLDEGFTKMYNEVQRQGGIFTSFAVFAILIACLGLFALATYMAEQRTKEIGIRKVLGASVAGITALLAKDFLKLVGIAILLAAPVAYYFMDQWLADFAYRIRLEWWIFAAAGIGALSIAFLTVGFQSLKAALANPVKSLKSE